MSDKIREFIEIPQQFVRDGNQVSLAFAPRVKELALKLCLYSYSS